VCCLNQCLPPGVWVSYLRQLTRRLQCGSAGGTILFVFTHLVFMLHHGKWHLLCSGSGNSMNHCYKYGCSAQNILMHDISHFVFTSADYQKWIRTSMII
jgi:hypothetical protein